MPELLGDVGEQGARRLCCRGLVPQVATAEDVLRQCPSLLSTREPVVKATKATDETAAEDARYAWVAGGADSAGSAGSAAPMSRRKGGYSSRIRLT
jgi:hypothetical protein